MCSTRADQLSTSWLPVWAIVTAYPRLSRPSTICRPDGPVPPTTSACDLELEAILDIISQDEARSTVMSCGQAQPATALPVRDPRAAGRRPGVILRASCRRASLARPRDPAVVGDRPKARDTGPHDGGPVSCPRALRSVRRACRCPQGRINERLVSIWTRS